MAASPYTLTPTLVSAASVGTQLHSDVRCEDTGGTSPLKRVVAGSSPARLRPVAQSAERLRSSTVTLGLGHHHKLGTRCEDLGYFIWDDEVAGSNPAQPTRWLVAQFGRARNVSEVVLVSGVSQLHKCLVRRLHGYFVVRLHAGSSSRAGPSRGWCASRRSSGLRHARPGSPIGRDVGFRLRS